MPENKKQLMRLIKLVAELKENRYPNRHSFAEKRRKSDIDGNMNVSCFSLFPSKAYVEKWRITG